MKSNGTTREPRRGILIPLVIGCAFFMEGLDSTMIAVAIPDMAESHGEHPLRLNLVITSYLLSLAVFIPLSGWIADRLGARVVFCAAIGLAFLEFAIENLGRPIIPAGLGLLFFPAAFVVVLVYIRHARRREDPILDLRLLRIRTFRIGTVTGSLCRMGLDATPFLLPLFFQVGFGLSPLHSGLLTFSSSLGAMIVRIVSGWFLRVFGFRRLLVGNAVLAAAVTAACGLLRPETPVWVIVALLLLSGCVRSIQYLGLKTVSYADVPPPLLSKSTSVGGVAQQLSRGFGVAVCATLLAVIACSAQGTIGH